MQGDVSESLFMGVSIIGEWTGAGDQYQSTVEVDSSMAWKPSEINQGNEEFRNQKTLRMWMSGLEPLVRLATKCQRVGCLFLEGTKVSRVLTGVWN